MLRAVLFDLDDTLFDHSGCARTALDAVYRACVCAGAHSFDDFVRTHAEHLETLHREVVAGTIDLDAARVERFRRVLLDAGATPEQAPRAAATYREHYMASRRAIRGAAAVLEALHASARIVIVSNNLLAEQRDKIEQCGLAPHVDALVVSEEVQRPSPNSELPIPNASSNGSLGVVELGVVEFGAGVPKPDPEIFRVALDAAGVSPSEAVMVGDSWSADVAGAHAVGIVPVWFNPRALPKPASPEPILELRAFEPVRAAVDTILQAHASRADRD